MSNRFVASKIKQILSVCGCMLQDHLPVGQMLTRLFLVRKIRVLKFGQVKSDTVLPKACHRCGIFLKGAVLLARAMTQRWAPPTCYTLWRNSAWVMKDLIMI